MRLRGGLFLANPEFPREVSGRVQKICRLSPLKTGCGSSTEREPCLLRPPVADSITTMDAKEPVASGSDSAISESPTRVAISPRKATMPTASGEKNESGQLSLQSKEAVWARRNRICPQTPKIPFDQPPRSIGTPNSSHNTSYQPRHSHKRGLFAFFKSHRKGKTRILNFLLLPIAVLAVFLAILVLFIFL